MSLPDEQDSKAVHNERLKLSATFLNGVAIAAIGVGVITPAVAYILDLQNLRESGPGLVVLLGVALLVIGLALHWLARKLLGDLR